MANVEEKTDNTSTNNTSNKININHRRIILTGATGVIGYSIAKIIIQNYTDISLHFTARNDKKGQKIYNDLSKYIKKGSNNKIYWHFVDLSSKKSIADFCENFMDKYSVLDVLINNASIVPNKYTLSKNKEELQYCVNILGYVRMMEGLKDALKLSKYKYGSRIVNVASQYTTKIYNVTDIECNPNDYSANKVYQRTKTAERMLTKQASINYKEYGINVFSCHPGVTTSNVLSGLGFGSGWDNPDKCAQTPVYLAMNSKVKSQYSGTFWSSCKMQSCQYCKDTKMVKLLWDYCIKKM